MSHFGVSRLAVLTAMTAGLGCVDPQGAYDDFGKRFTDINQTSSASTGGGEGGSCTPMAGSGDGKFYLLLSSTLAKTAPIAFTLDITSSPGDGGGLDLHISGKALAAADRRTPVGAAVTPDRASVAADGTISVGFDAITIDGRADTLIMGAEIQAKNVALTGGSYCSPTFMCGTVTGMATKPTALDLMGSTWTLQAMDHGAFPDHDYYDCAMDVAAPPQ